MRLPGPERVGKTPPAAAWTASTPESAPAADARPVDALMRLQRVHGNRHVGRLLHRSARDHHERRTERARPEPATGGADRPVPPRSGGLPDRLLDALARESGIDLSGVVVHRSSPEPGRVDAHAYATGSDIHLAPGADHHLAHEAWHLVQQRQGRVPATGHLDGRALNIDPALEHEADVMGDRLAAAPASGPVPARAVPSPRDAPLQLKSKFTAITPAEENAETPITTLSNAFGPFFRAAEQLELYTFGSASPFLNVDPGKYSDSYDRAGEVEADIDGGWQGGNGADRDNEIISAYGHFGVMERAIFHRQNIGNTYDGGHLVEHTLMKGRDADVHGNLAPQENKNFNQGLMRGLERIPETLQHSEHRSFSYRVKVSYSGDSYTRTGAEMLGAGILPQSLEDALPATGAHTAAALNGLGITFRRWVPHEWRTWIDTRDGKDFPPLSFTRGVQHRNLAATRADAESAVYGTGHTAHTGPTPLRRQNSGTLGGYIEGVTTIPGTDVLTWPARPSYHAMMFQPEPQDVRDQARGTTTPSGTVPAVLPAAAPAESLKAPLSLTDLVTEIARAPLRREGNGAGKMPGFKKVKTVDTAAKLASSGYRILRGYIEDGDGVKLARALHDVADPDAFSKADFVAVVLTANLTTRGRNKLIAIANDVNFV